MPTAQAKSQQARQPAAMEASSWLEENQRALGIALARLRALLEPHISSRAMGGDLAPAAGGEPAFAAPPALAALRRAFGLSDFECDLLLLCAAPELESSFAALLGQAHGDPTRNCVTFSLALASLPGAHWSALTPPAPLRAWQLVEVERQHALTSSPVRISERALHFLVGINEPDQRLAPILESIVPDHALPPSQQIVCDKIAALFGARTSTRPARVQICGDDPASSRAVAAAACVAVGLGLRSLPAEAIPAQAADLDLFTRLLAREAVLLGSAFLIDCTETDFGDTARVAAVRQLLERSPGYMMVSVRDRQRWGSTNTVTFEVGRPTVQEQQALWRSALGPAAEHMNGEIDLLASHFDIGAQAIHTACAQAVALPVSPANAREAQLVLWDACRDRARPKLDGLAQRIDSAPAWEDLILPDAQKSILRDMAAHVRQRAKVYENWGFAKRGKRGLGFSALFAGVSGTGKTLAAEVLAHELRLDLYRIDLSSVVSKYIGETEKNLRRVFDAGEEAGAVLLFDEADALFGKRSEVKDSHDRYANIEVSYLLQRMECYKGLAILTTNLKSSLDTAFLRRIRFIVQFPFPDAEQRAAIWRRIFPAETPLENLDCDRLAQLNIAGGNIRNIALGAAFFAAEAGETVSMSHLLHAAQSEYAKIEKTLTDTEIAGWSD